MTELLLFDRFDLDARRRRLRRGGRLVRVPPQSMTVLLALVRCAGETVTRQELHAALWPAGTHVEFEPGLNTAVRRLRRALGDDAAKQRFIQTIPGTGYRFICPVERVPASVPAPPSPLPKAAAAPQRRPQLRIGNLMRAAAVIALAILRPGLVPALEPRMPMTGADQTPGATRADLSRAIIEHACELKRLGQPQLALAVIETGLAHSPRSAALRAHRGLYLHAVGRYEEEMAALHEAVAIDPHSAEAHFHLGLGYARRRQYTESLASLQAAVVLSDGEPQFLSWLGRIAAEAGRRREAEEALHALQRRAASSPIPPSLIDSVAYYLAVSRS